MPEAEHLDKERPKPTIGARALLILAGVAAGVYALDQISKNLVVANLAESEKVPILGELLAFQFVRNPGAAFSLASGSTWIFTIIATAVTVFIVIFARRIRSVGWAVLFGLLLGGTTGNLTDRYIRDPGFPSGHVIDFLQIPLLPAIFNIADVAIVSSMVVFLILTLRGVGLDGTREVKHAHGDRDADRDPDSGSDSDDASDAARPTAVHPDARTGDDDRGRG